MKKDRMERLEDFLFFLPMAWIPIHLYLSWINFANGIDKGYGHSFPMRSYVLIGVYLLIVLAVDLFLICRQKPELSKGFRRYWGSAGICILICFLINSVWPENGLLAALFLLYPPYLVLVPLLEFLGMEDAILNLLPVGGFCLFNWAVCRFFVRER